MIHFDSHPDLLIPTDLEADDAYSKQKLFEKLSIENWILPGVYVGVFRTVIWVCPWWSHQILPGEYSFEIGRNKHTNKLNVTCLESYYISEGLFNTTDNLDNLKEVKLILDLVKFVMCSLVTMMHVTPVYLQKGTQSLETRVQMPNLTRFEI